jgi:hypothetical protein
LHKENYSKMTSPSYMASKDDNEWFILNEVETAVVYSRVLSQQLPGRPKEGNVRPQWRLPVSETSQM